MKPVEILNQVAAIYAVDVKAIISDTRREPVISARAVYSYICCEQNISYTEIGTAINRHRTSVYKFCERGKDIVYMNKEVRKKLIERNLL